MKAAFIFAAGVICLLGIKAFADDDKTSSALQDALNKDAQAIHNSAFTPEYQELLNSTKQQEEGAEKEQQREHMDSDRRF